MAGENRVVSQAEAGESPAGQAALAARIRPTFIAVAVMAGTMAFIAWEFTGVVAAPWLYGWVGYMLAVDAALLASLLLCALPSSPRRWPLRRWARFSRWISVAFSVGIVASVWFMLPPAGPDLRMLCILLYVWFIAVMMMSSGTLPNMIGCLALLASLLGFVVTSDITYRWEMAVFLVSVGAALVGIRRSIWRAADDAAAARALSEQAAVVLEQGLALVEAQRDAKTRFIAAASHDLQQPLQAARLFVEQLDTLPPGPARVRAQAGASSALRSSQALIGQMLDFLRLEADAEVARTRPLAIGTLLREVAAEHAPGTTMRLTAVGEVEAVADPAMLRRAVGNLVANAAKHSAGTRLLLIARRLGAGSEGRAVIWAVDDGRGVAPADRATLFDDFSQGARAAPGGFGLGLASARRLVAAMGGTIGLDPRWTGGAAFFIELPLAVPLTTEAAPRAAAPEVPRCAAA